jgi:hypothetical protein
MGIRTGVKQLYVRLGKYMQPLRDNSRNNIANYYVT